MPQHKTKKTKVKAKSKPKTTIVPKKSLGGSIHKAQAGMKEFRSLSPAEQKKRMDKTLADIHRKLKK